MLRNRVRGANPIPGAYTEWDGKTLKVHRATTGIGRGVAGEILDIKDGITVATGDGALCLTEVQPEGRPRMPADDFVRGYQMKKGLRLGDTPSP